MKFVNTSLLAATFASCLLSGAAVAQQNTAQPATSTMLPQQSEEFTVSEQQVADFVDAYVAIKVIGQQYRAKIRSVGDKTRVPELQKEARGEMKNAIINTGLGLSEYKQIVLAANHNPTLRDRISAAMGKVSLLQPTSQAGS